MGFKFNKVSDGECLIESTSTNEDAIEFLGCIQEALKTLSLRITVDITQRPSSLGMILLDLIKLQNVVKRQYGAVTIKGLSEKIPAPFIDKIRQSGIVIAASRPKDADSSSGLPPNSEMSLRLLDIQKLLSEALQRKKFLERENKSYHERLVELNKNVEMTKEASKLNEKLIGLELELTRLKDHRVQLQKDLGKSEKEIKPVEEESKKAIAANFVEHKKLIEPLDRKVTELKKQKEKIEADFKKRNETRQIQISQMMKKMKPSESP